MLENIIKSIKKLDNFFYKLLINRYNNKFLLIISQSGNIIFIFFFIIILFFLPLQNAKVVSISCFISFFLNTIIIFIIKHIFKRKRITNDNYLLNKFDPFSFPSGHINRLAGLIVPTLQIFWLSLIIFVITILTAISRMSKGFHYFTDCIAGFTIGIICGFISNIISIQNISIIQKILNF